MKLLKQKSWKHEITGFEGNAELFGVNIFDYNWEATGEKVNVFDPLYNQPYKFNVYKIIINGNTNIFAAGEFSNIVWGFYLFKY